LGLRAAIPGESRIFYNNFAKKERQEHEDKELIFFVIFAFLCGNLYLVAARSR
jgi:hypothetical protein